MKARAARLRAAAARRHIDWLDSLAGSEQSVLIEGDGTGHSDNFAPVTVLGAKRGQTFRATIVERQGERLVGLAA